MGYRNWTNTPYLEHEKRVSRTALQRDGKYAFTADGGNEGFIWDLKTGEK